jgi:hypothetical protein
MKYQDNKDCIEACMEAATYCKHCAVSCLREEQDEMDLMSKVIRLNLECAVACYATAELMTIGSDRAQEYAILCAEICELCARECDNHNNEHCRQSARNCRRAAKLCREMVAKSELLWR